MQRLTGILVTTAAMGTVVAGVTPLAAADTAGGANNVVLVSNTVDGATASRSRLAVAHDPADTVANQNIASATGNDCNGCRTVAVAMQLVVVEGDPSTFAPANAAVAQRDRPSVPHVAAVPRVVRTRASRHYSVPRAVMAAGLVGSIHIPSIRFRRPAGATFSHASAGAPALYPRAPPILL